jgi:hypothetical protein
LDRSSHKLQDSVNIAQYVVVPESQHDKSFGFKNGSSPGIGGASFSVLSAIYFNDEFRIQAYEIDNEPVDGHLALELHSQAAAVAQPRRHLALGAGWLLSQKPRDTASACHLRTCS